MNKYFSLNDTDDAIISYSAVEVLFYDEDKKQVGIQTRCNLFIYPDPRKKLFEQIKAGLNGDTTRSLKNE